MQVVGRALEGLKIVFMAMPMTMWVLVLVERMGSGDWGRKRI